MKAAVFILDKIMLRTVECSRTCMWKRIKYLFSIVQKLILVNSDEIMNVRFIDSNDPSLAKVKISHPQVVTWAKVHVFSDSVPCLGKCREPAEAVERRKGQLMDFQKDVSEHFYGIDLLSSSGIFSQDLRHWNGLSMFNDIDWNKKNNEGECVSHSEEMRNFAKRFSRGRWTFFGLGSEEKWCGSYLSKPEGKWNSVAAQMPQRFVEMGHPIFTVTRSLNRGVLRRKKNKNTIHFNAESSDVELSLRIIHCANQLSVN